MAEITPGQAYGFFTDTSVCIGCKACEVACKQWNQLPGNEPVFGDGYDNTGSLDSQNWRHVQFIDNVPDETMGAGQGKAWLMMSDVCKHCAHASCMEVCPTGAIIRTEFDTVFIQAPVCNGCRNCIAACPYDVIDIDPDRNASPKCTPRARPRQTSTGTTTRSTEGSTPSSCSWTSPRSTTSRTERTPSCR